MTADDLLEKWATSPPSSSESDSKLSFPRILPALSVLMRLGAAIFMGLNGFLVIVGVTNSMWQFLFLGGLGFLRSLFHLLAGTAIQGDGKRNERLPIVNYIVASLVQTVVSIWLLKGAGGDGVPVLWLLPLLLAWPAALAVIVALPAVRREMKAPAARGAVELDALATYMLLFGIVGGLCALLFVVQAINVIRVSMGLIQLLFLLTAALLLVRSAVHARTGWQGLRDPLASRLRGGSRHYVTLGIVSAIAVPIVLLFSLGRGLNFGGFMMIGLAGFLLASWPLQVKGLIPRCVYAGVVNGVRQDAARTAMGWWLLISSVLSLAFLLTKALMQPGLVGHQFSELLQQSSRAGQLGDWINFALLALQLWAAIELLGMSPRLRTAGLIYGAAGVLNGVVQLILQFPASQWLAMGSQELETGTLTVMTLLAALISLTTPVVTIWIVLRRAPARQMSEPESVELADPALQ